MIRIGLVYPELLGTYGDGGNAIVLAQRARWRGHAAEVIPIGIDDALPAGIDIFVLGGGEDAPQTLATQRLAEHGFARAIDDGAAVLAVCASLQILGHSFTGADGETIPGLGVLDVTTRPLGTRMIGELVVESTAFELPVLTGFENHGGITELGSGCEPLGRVRAGYGNGGDDAIEGAVAGRVVGTYLHGCALARNPALADLLLSWFLGPLDPLDDTLVDRMRAERIDEALDNPPRFRRLRAALWGR